MMEAGWSHDPWIVILDGLGSIGNDGGSMVHMTCGLLY